MGHREEISMELDQLACEIEKDALLARGEHVAKISSPSEAQIRLELVIAQHALTGLQMRISVEPVNDGRSS